MPHSKIHQSLENYINIELGAICAVVETSATATVINNCSLLTIYFRKAYGIEIITVGGYNHHLTHIGAPQISIKDDTSRIYHITIPNVLYFLLLPVNILSAGKLSLDYSDGLTHYDDGAHVKTTCGRSCFSWNHDKHFKPILHPES